MKKPGKKVLVGMSGGIDSSATCIMLQEQGYEVTGVTMRVWGDAPEEAAVLAKQLGIEHYIADERKEFKDTIVKYFIDEYLNGRTPNPCVMCNPLFKFRMLAEWADKMGCARIATGHYARLKKINGKTYIVAGEDEKKDQSYFLWKLGQDVLSRCMFPLGSFNKTQVREYLSGKGFESKSQDGESMEICFIKGDYRNFLREHYPAIDEEIGPGWLVDQEGVKLGQHKGYAYYTVGQRKGLEIALGKPAYVLRINPRKNTVMLGGPEQLRTKYMLAEQPCIVDKEDFFSCDNMSVRIRYRSKPIPCKVSERDDGRLIVVFAEEASAVTPGQSAVFYDGKRVLGGAFIASQRGIGLIIEELNLS